MAQIPLTGKVVVNEVVVGGCYLSAKIHNFSRISGRVGAASTTFPDFDCLINAARNNIRR